MPNFLLYIEKSLLLNDSDMSEVEGQIKNLENIISDSNRTPLSLKAKRDTYLEISKLYFISALYDYFSNEKDSSYHHAFVGYVYLQIAKEITKLNDQVYIDLAKAELKFISLLSFLSPPITSKIYHIACDKKIMLDDIRPPTEVTDFLDSINSLHHNSIHDSDMSAYQALVAVGGYKGKISNVEILTLMSDALLRLKKDHPCYSELTSLYDKYLKNLNVFPLVFNTNRLVNYHWGIHAFYRLCDDWLLNKVANRFLFEPAREFQTPTLPLGELDTKLRLLDFDQQGKPINYSNIKKRELVKFICHLHPVGITWGSTPDHNTFIIDIALKQLGFLDANFRKTRKNLKDLLKPELNFQFLQAIKENARKYGYSLREDEIKKYISEDFVQESLSRNKSISYFISLFFESFDFNTAFFLLYKSLMHDCHYLTPDNHPFIHTFNNVKSFLSNSFSKYQELRTILEKPEKIPQKLTTLKNYCESLIDHTISTNKKLLLQIQAHNPLTGEGHGIYAVLETINSKNVNKKKGVQLVLSNGGFGESFHARSDKKFKKTGNDVYNIVSKTWPNSDWTVHIGQKYLSNNDYIKYKIIKIDDVDNKEARDAFCYYLMLCCAGYFLTHAGNKFCTFEEYIDTIYDVKNKTISHKNWVKKPSNLSHLVILDSNEIMPKQIMGNCTVFNALHAIKYAEKLEAAQFWFLGYLIEIGLDKYFSLLNLPLNVASKIVIDENKIQPLLALDNASNISLPQDHVLTESILAARRLKYRHNHWAASQCLNSLGIFGSNGQRVLERLKQQGNPDIQHEYDKHYALTIRPPNNL